MTINDALLDELGSDLGLGDGDGENEENGGNGGKTLNWPYKCTYWFQPKLWSKIEFELKLNANKLWIVVQYLQCRYVMLDSKSLFDGLMESALRGWF